MRVHPAPMRRNITFHYGVNPNHLSFAAAEAIISRQKKLRRLPHIFSKVLELPFASDAIVEVEEGPTRFRFIAATDDLDADVRAHAIEIYPGIMKVVIRDGGGDLEDELELDRWRIRLPSETRPWLATAEYVHGELIVTVPKGARDDEEEEERAEFGVRRLMLVQ